MENMAAMTGIRLKNIQKSYQVEDRTVPVLNGIDLDIPAGTITVILGQSGCGKTTLLRLTGGLEEADGGEILWDGNHKTAFVFQEPRLMPWLNVWDNVVFGVKKNRQDPEMIRKLIHTVGLSGFEKAFPSQLSGGMKRKLMVCRALLTEPEILFLDEPTAGMDAFARRQMWNLLKKLNQQKLTILLTTHYMEEAETLCDRVGFMCGGRLEETDAPGHMIETLGRYAVDETLPDGLKSHYFHGKEEAIQYLSASEQETALRSTTLEDVFLETIGQQLECR